jgi:hypothetical protein
MPSPLLKNLHYAQNACRGDSECNGLIASVADHVQAASVAHYLANEFLLDYTPCRFLNGSVAPMTILLFWITSAVVMGYLAKNKGYRTWPAWTGASILFSLPLTLIVFLIVDAKNRKRKTQLERESSKDQPGRGFDV